MPYRLIRTMIANQTVLCAPPQTSVSKGAALMRKSKVGAIMVVQGRHLVGIFTERDALFRVIADGRDADATRLADVMTPNPQTVHPDKPLRYALHLMFEGGFRHMPVVEHGQPIGMVSARDSLGPELKEFVSELEVREHIAEVLR